MANVSEETEQKVGVDLEGQDKKLPFPKPMWFIVIFKYCLRFSFVAIEAVLANYLNSNLQISQDTSTVILHALLWLAYTTPLLGAILADQFLGKYRAILWSSFPYILGMIFITLATIPDFGLPPTEISIIGLVLFAIGYGSILPCVPAFGGDQFKMPDQTNQLQSFFSILYFAQNAGSLSSLFIIPVLTKDIKCFEDQTCYASAFGVPILLTLAATVILVVGNYTVKYEHKIPQKSILTQVFGSIGYAFKRKVTTSEQPDHWLDLAKDKYSIKLIDDVKILLKVLVIYIPLPMYFTLMDQKGSRWTFQANQMNGQFGSYIIKPEQIRLFNPAFVLILIPLFDKLVYPLCSKLNFLKKPLQRMIIGGILTACAFFISGFLEVQLSKNNDVHILWVIPQVFVLTVGEIMIMSTILEFAYSQAPKSMKSVLQACLLLSEALGNLIVLIVAQIKFFDQVSEFFMFGVLMLLDMVLLSYLAYNYTYINITTEEELDATKATKSIGSE